VDTLRLQQGRHAHRMVVDIVDHAPDAGGYRGVIGGRPRTGDVQRLDRERHYLRDRRRPGRSLSNSAGLQLAHVRLSLNQWPGVRLRRQGQFVAAVGRPCSSRSLITRATPWQGGRRCPVRGYPGVHRTCRCCRECDSCGRADIGDVVERVGIISRVLHGRPDTALEDGRRGRHRRPRRVR